MKNGRFTTVLLILLFCAGLSLLMYPTVSNYWNSIHQTRAISSYSETVASINPDDYEKYFEEARAFNARILSRENIYAPSDIEKQNYQNALNLAGNGIMGYIEIPSIEVTLPIYHGTSDAVLQIAVGHLDWTSLPVGGLGTHTVLSGHRGLPSAKLFTHLDKLTEGDVFMIRVLNEILTYQVDSILIVEPQVIEPLTIESGKDYCTLVTCTPYGINTHRLLVRGHRIENAKEAAAINITAEAIQIDPMIIASIVGVLLMIMLIISVLFGGKKKQ